MGQLLEQVFDPVLLETFRRFHATSSLGFGSLALGASTLHLGRPRYAYRAVLGLWHSWLSREIVAFSTFAMAACMFAGACWSRPSSWVFPLLGGVVAITGLMGVFCSIMIYVFTRRECWRFGSTAAKFGLTSAVLGIAATWLSLLVFGSYVDSPVARLLSRQAGVSLVHALVLATVVKLLLEASIFRHLLSRRQSPLKRSAQLLAGSLFNATVVRFSCGLLGGLVMPWFLLSEITSESENRPLLVISVGLICVACFVGELLERYQFYAACATPRMPGTPNS